MQFLTFIQRWIIRDFSHLWHKCRPEHKQGPLDWLIHQSHKSHYKAQCSYWDSMFFLNEHFSGYDSLWFIFKALKIGFWLYLPCSRCFYRGRHFYEFLFYHICCQAPPPPNWLYFWWTSVVSFLIFYLELWHLHFWWRLIVTFFSCDVLSDFPYRDDIGLTSQGGDYSLLNFFVNSLEEFVYIWCIFFSYVVES